MSETFCDFVAYQRHLLIHREAARIQLSGERISCLICLRAAVNERYATFGIRPLSDGEFSLLTRLLERGPRSVIVQIHYQPETDPAEMRSTK